MIELGWRNYVVVKTVKARKKSIRVVFIFDVVKDIPLIS